MDESFGTALKAHLEPYRQQVFTSDFVKLAQHGKLTIGAGRAWLAQQFAYVQLFPSLFGLVLRKVDDRAVRGIIAENIVEELEHPAMWLRLCAGAGMSEAQVREAAANLCPEMQALNDSLMLTCLEDHPAPSMAALGVALEGLTEGLIRALLPAMLSHYHGKSGIDLSKSNIGWILEHQGADPKHSAQALQVVTTLADTDALRERCKRVSARAIEFFGLGFDGVVRRYNG